MYPKISDDQIAAKDFMNNGNDALALKTLQQLSLFNVVTPDIEGGAADSTVTEYVFVAPTKLEITSASFIRNVMNTGAGNTPEVLLQNGSTIIAQQIIPLTGAVGDATNITLVPDHVVVDKGAVLKVLIITPDQTITTKAKGKIQIAGKSIL